MLAHRAEFAGLAASGPQKLDLVAGAAFGANAFRRFLAQAQGLNGLNCLVGVAGLFFRFHGHFSVISALG